MEACSSTGYAKVVCKSGRSGALLWFLPHPARLPAGTGSQCLDFLPFEVGVWTPSLSENAAATHRADSIRGAAPRPALPMGPRPQRRRRGTPPITSAAALSVEANGRAGAFETALRIVPTWGTKSKEERRCLSPSRRYQWGVSWRRAMGEVGSRAMAVNPLRSVSSRTDRTARGRHGTGEGGPRCVSFLLSPPVAPLSAPPAAAAAVGGDHRRRCGTRLPPPPSPPPWLALRLWRPTTGAASRGRGWRRAWIGVC